MAKVNLVSRLIEPKITPEGKRRHSGCLTLWLAFSILVCAMFFMYTFTGLTLPKGFFLHYAPPALPSAVTLNVYGFDLTSIAVNLLVLIGVVGVWLWKKWGYYLLLGLYTLQFVLDSIVQFPHIINQHTYNYSVLFGLAIFYALISKELPSLKRRTLPLRTEESVS